MPELPEIAHLKGSLEPLLLGATVRRVRLFRRDVVRTAAVNLLSGRTIRGLVRHGKELALVSDTGRTVLVHLGMSGQLSFCPTRRRLPRPDHVHCVWTIESQGGPDGHSVRGRLFFRDPRRFGGLWCFDSLETLESERWSRLGPDALAIKAAILSERLRRTTRAVKTALLDQRVVAGIGNIYADEILFRAAVDPRSSAHRVPAAKHRDIARAARAILASAISAGGSSIRDYRDGNGRAGRFVQRHKVYGRAGHACVRCRTTLRLLRLAQRSTVFCPSCQELFR